MSEIKLNLEPRTLTGKKLTSLRASGLIPSVIYGDKEPILTASAYVETEKALEKVGYHSPIKLLIDKKEKLALVKTIATDPVSRRIINIEFQAVSKTAAVEATTPVVIENFEASEASKTFHFAYTQSIEELDVKAKPADLPEKLTIDASKLTSLEDKLTINDIVLPKGVEFADKELDPEQVVTSLYDPAAEAAAREAEAEEETEVDAADVPSDNGSKPEEASEEKTE